jgi:hypothetical protein
MSRIVIAIAIGMFALGVFADRAISITPNADATVNSDMSNVNHIMPFDIMVKARDLPPLDFSAAF